MKLCSNSKFWDGLQVQTIQYLKSEEVRLGYFVAVGFEDADFDEKRITRLRETAERRSEETGKDVRFALVDARRKESASKLKSPKDD